MKKRKINLSVAVPPELKEALSEQARRKGLELSSYVRMILTEGIKK